MPDFSDLLLLPFSDNPHPPESHNCYTLVTEVFHRFGIEIPPINPAVWTQMYIIRVIEQNRVLTDSGDGFWKEIKHPVTPCLILMKVESEKLANHVGVYLGRRKFIHATKTREDLGSISMPSIDTPYWKAAIRGYYVPRD